MKKITMFFMLFMFFCYSGHGQVAIGEESNELQMLPFSPYYPYNYTQSIYLASEINAAGFITSFKWYFSGTSNLTNSQELVVYFGLTDRTAFTTQNDFVPIEELVQVYSGGIVSNGTQGWVTITLSTPYEYDGVSNLVIAVDENQAQGDDFNDDFHNSEVIGARSIYVSGYLFNPDPAAPNANLATAGMLRGVSTFVPNIILEGLQQACPKPTALTASNVTDSSAVISWTEGFGQTSWEVLVQEESLGVPTANEAGIAIESTATYLKTGLSPSTVYSIYVRNICADNLKSPWVGPKKFTTQCVAFGDFEEGFETTAVGAIPECWNRIVTADNSYFSHVKVVEVEGLPDLKLIEFLNGDDLNAQLYLITPSLVNLGTSSHRIKFKAFANRSTSLIVGTMTDPSDASTFTPLSTLAVTDNYAEYSYTFTAATTDNYIAFKHGLEGGLYTYIYLNDIGWESAAVLPPDCVDVFSATINESCGNFANVIAWDAVPGAYGYHISISTSPNGADFVVDNLDVFSALTYSFTGIPDTTYYYNITPYNNLGVPDDCSGGTFSTSSDGCYCIPTPLSISGGGITKVVINETEFFNDPVPYYDFSDENSVDITRGVYTSIFTSFNMGVACSTNIWIDANDNFNFEPSELVFTNAANIFNPTVLTTSFYTSLGLTLGTHRMRIGVTDSTQTPPDACYSGYYGVTLDFMINVLEAPSCLPPVNSTVSNVTATTAEVSWTSSATSFNIEYGSDYVSQGMGIIISDITSNQVVLPNLEPQSDYHYYLQANCAEGESPWVGPFLFTTACTAFDSFSENFSTEAALEAPGCWSTLIENGSSSSLIINHPVTDDLVMRKGLNTDEALYLITPLLSDLGNDTHRVRFNASSVVGASVVVGTMTNPADALTFTPVQSIPLTNVMTQYTVPFTTQSTDSYIAFQLAGSIPAESVAIDDFTWEEIPTGVPDCASNLVVLPHVSCGNSATVFNWSAVPNADFYNLTIGTGSSEFITINLGNVTTASYSGIAGTSYYYKLVPGNSNGLASNCLDGNFTTFAVGCYCPSVPEPVFIDGNGITSLSIGTSTYSVPVTTYFDATSEVPALLTQGENSVNSITFETGYVYDSNVWIDWNNNFTFEATEKVVSAQSTADLVSVVDLSFLVPSSVAPGVYRMRIGSLDAGLEVTDPCYSDYFGITIDLNVEVEAGLGTIDFDHSNLSIYPNPVKDVLHINYADTIDNVAIYNLVGQQLQTIKPFASAVKIDLSHLPTGTYLVKMSSGSILKTAKIIKE